MPFVGSAAMLEREHATVGATPMHVAPKKAPLLQTIFHVLSFFHSITYQCIERTSSSWSVAIRFNSYNAHLCFETDTQLGQQHTNKMLLMDATNWTHSGPGRYVDSARVRDEPCDEEGPVDVPLRGGHVFRSREAAELRGLICGKIGTKKTGRLFWAADERA